MAERYFILDGGEARLDATMARRQFSLSLAVGLAVLAAAALIELQPARSAPIGVEAHHGQIVQAEFALAASSHRHD
jgi:hypothetical protein